MKSLLVTHFSLGSLNGKKGKIKFSSHVDTKSLTKSTAIISPKRPMALPKISTIKIRTKSEGSAASASAAPDPTWPTQRPQTKLTTPVVSPAPNMR